MIWIKDSSFSDGKITVPIKVEQHFSAGEQQIFVMSLYQSLAEIRTSELPFVIDSLSKLLIVTIVDSKSILITIAPNIFWLIISIGQNALESN